MLNLFIITSIFMGIAIAGLAIRMLLVKGGKFPNTHLEHNPHMQARGIGCARDEKSLCQGISAPKKGETITCTGKPGMEESCAAGGFRAH